jgi:hypothetical protein
MIDFDALDAALHARIRATVPALADLGTADAIDDELLARRVRPPAAFTCLLRRNAKRRVPGSPKQMQLLEVRIGIITAGVPLTSGAVTGPEGSNAIKRLLMKALHGWALPGTGTSGILDFAEEDRIGAVAGRSLWEQVYVTTLQETYS